MLKKALLVMVVLSICFAAFAGARPVLAGTVWCNFTGPADNYRALLFRTGNALPSGWFDFNTSLASAWRTLRFPDVPQGWWFIRVTLWNGAYLTQTGQNYLANTWYSNTLRLNDIRRPGF
jgi:hypothetical protein